MKMQKHKISYVRKDGTRITKTYQYEYKYVSKKKDGNKRMRYVDRLTDEKRDYIINYYEAQHPDLKGTLIISDEYNCVLSSKGRAFSLNVNMGEIGQNGSNHGYHHISNSLLHLAIYKTFSKVPYDPNLDVDHIDGNKSNNDISNLRQLTHKENLNAAIEKREKHWCKGVNIGAKHVSSQPVLQYSKDGKLIKDWESQNLAATSLGVHQSAINACINGRVKTAYGYIWKRKNN